MHSDRGEVALAQELVQLSSPERALDENDDLVELEFVQEFIELAVLLLLLEGNVVLRQAVERQLSILVDIVLRRVLHELPADGLDLVREGGGKHHDLLLLRSSTEDLLNVATHVYCHQHDRLAMMEFQWAYQSGQASCRTHRG